MSVKYKRHMTSHKLKELNTNLEDLSKSQYTYDDRFGTGLPAVDCNLKEPGRFVFDFFKIEICVQVDGTLGKKGRYNIICYDGVTGPDGIKEKKYNISRKAVSEYLKNLNELNDKAKLK